MLKTLALVALTCICTFGKAQRKESPALLVTMHYDTLKVWVSAGESVGDIHSIRIKKDSLDKRTESWPASAVRSLIVANGPYYRGAAVLLDQTPVDLEVSGSFDSSYITLVQDTVLLKTEFLGEKISLFSLIDHNKSHFFVQMGGGSIQELFDRRYKLLRNGEVVETEDKTYLRQLEQLMADCPNVATNLLDVSYNSDALKKAARIYNNCGQKAKTVYESETVKGRFQIALLAGLGFSDISVQSSPGNPLNLTNPVKSNSSFAGGVGFDYFFGRTDKKFSIAGTVLYDHIQGSESQYREYGSPQAYTLQTLTIDYKAVQVDVLCRYTIPLQGDLRPFIDGGSTFFGALSKNNTTNVDEFYDNAHHVSNTDPFDGGFKSFQAGLIVGAGLRYKRLGLEYKFESISNIGSYGNIGVRVNAQQLMLFFNLKN
jgi:Outer membrane protein beta-barrel domain